MAPRTRYRLDRVQVEPGEARAATWTFAGSPMAGTEHVYAVRDENFRSRNEWEFVVRVPRGRNERIEVRPRVTPNVRVWAEPPKARPEESGIARWRWPIPPA